MERKWLSGLRIPRQLFFARLSSADRGSARSPGRNAPEDIILEIAVYLSRVNILEFSLTSRSLYNLLFPTLYHSVDLKSNEQCRATLTSLIHRPYLAQCIRKLVVRPNHQIWASRRTGRLDESWVAALIEQIAKAGDLAGLHTFRWDGLEAPPDGLWLTLRTWCPCLRNIGTSVGQNSERLDPESHLFDFRDLTGFSLILQRCVPFSEVSSAYQQLPDRLWEMLLLHSPNLQELTMDGYGPFFQLWNIRQLVSGRWPALRSISFGELASAKANTDFQNITSFLESHPTLESISVAKCKLPAMPRTALPRVRSFSGSISQIHLLPTPGLLQSLWLTHWIRPSKALIKTLPTFSSLTSLGIRFCGVSDQSDSPDFYGYLLKFFPRLSHLEILSASPLVLVSQADYLTQRPGLYIHPNTQKDFSAPLRHASQLRTFLITRVHQPDDDDMLQSAVEIALRNPGLQQFTIKDVLAWDYLATEEVQIKAVGTYTVRLNERGVIASLGVREAGIGRFGQRYSRSYVHNVKNRSSFYMFKLVT